MRKLVCGVGINDADYVVQPMVNGKRTFCPFYGTWFKMIQRGYSDKEKKRNPTYKIVTVCKEWHAFSTFKAWMMQQDWEGNCIDKDLFELGNKEYSPSKCMFVSREINTIIVNCKASRGEFPVGVCFHKKRNKFVSYCSLNGKDKHLGVFGNFIDAHRAWQLFKIQIISNASKKEASLKISLALKRIYEKIQFDYDNNLETII